MSPSYSTAQRQEIKLPEPHEQVVLIMHCALALHQAFLMGSRGALEVSIKITAEWRGNRELRRGGPAGGDVAAVERVGMKSGAPCCWLLGSSSALKEGSIHNLLIRRI